MGETTVNNIKLTRREMSILQEVAIGRTTPQIAEDLGLSPETVAVEVFGDYLRRGGAQSDYEQYTIKL